MRDIVIFGAILHKEGIKKKSGRNLGRMHQI